MVSDYDENGLGERISRWLWVNIGRPLKFFYQRRTRGFDDSETWDMSVTFSEFILPRLKAFRQFYDDPKNKFMGVPCNITYPDGTEIPELEGKIENSLNVWLSYLDQMIIAFDSIVNEDKVFELSGEELSAQLKLMHQQREVGLKLFAQYFQNLWW